MFFRQVHNQPLDGAFNRTTGSSSANAVARLSWKCTFVLKFPFLSPLSTLKVLIGFAAVISEVSGATSTESKAVSAARVEKKHHRLSVKNTK